MKDKDRDEKRKAVWLDLTRKGDPARIPNPFTIGFNAGWQAALEAKQEAPNGFCSFCGNPASEHYCYFQSPEKSQYNHVASPAPEGIDKTMTDEQIKHMVERFLTWRLPENFNPDGGITFKPMFNEHTDHPMRHKPVGTNLLDATQAEQMVRYMVEGMKVEPVDSPSGEPGLEAELELSRAYNESLHELIERIWKAIEPTGEYEGDLGIVEFAESVRKERDSSSNYVCDKECQPAEVRFNNGRVVKAVGGFLEVLPLAAPASEREGK